MHQTSKELAGMFQFVGRLCYKTLPAVAFFTAAWSQTTFSLRAPHALPNANRAQVGPTQPKPPDAIQAGARFRFITIDIPGSTGAYAYAINNLDVVTGSYLDASSNWHGFIWRNGTLSTVDKPGFLDTIMGFTNNLEVAVGNFGDQSTQHAVRLRLSSRSWTTLPDIPQKPINFAGGINDFGAIIGFGGDNNVNAPLHGVPWIWYPSKRAYTFFTVPGATGEVGANAFGINNRGQAVGGYQDGNGHFHGFIKEGQLYTIIDVPGAAETGGSAINNWGTVVAGWEDYAGVEHGFLRTADGVFYTMDFPGSAFSMPAGINDRGDLSGFWADSSGLAHAWVGLRY